MSEVQTTPRRETLFSIEAELLGLLDQRGDALERRDQADADGNSRVSEECDQELQTINLLIKQYVNGHLVQKTDSCAWAITEYEARAKAKAETVAQLKASADRDAETAKRIKAMVLEVMQEFNEKNLPGRLFTITRQGNGGQQALTIAQPDLIPLEFKRVTVELRADVCRQFAEQFAGQYRIVEIVHPDSKDIRVALESGKGVMGACLEDRGEHIRIK